jgi:hypothetical protein
MDHVRTGRKLSLLKKKNENTLLGSGELGEFTIAAQRIGQTIIAVDSYENAPAKWHTVLKSSTCLTEALDRIVASTNLILLFLRLKPFVLNVLRLRKQGICSSFCESGKFHNEPKSHP